MMITCDELVAYPGCARPLTQCQLGLSLCDPDKVKWSWKMNRPENRHHVLTTFATCIYTEGGCHVSALSQEDKMEEEVEVRGIHSTADATKSYILVL